MLLGHGLKTVGNVQKGLYHDQAVTLYIGEIPLSQLRRTRSPSNTIVVTSKEGTANCRAVGRNEPRTYSLGYMDVFHILVYRIAWGFVHSRRTPRRTDSSVRAAILTAWNGLSKIRPADEMCVVSRPAPRDPPPFIALTSLT